MVQVPAVFQINEVTEKMLRKKQLPQVRHFIINYRDWKKLSVKSPVYKIPLEFCLFRTDNGRIMTEVLSYQTSKGSLEQIYMMTQMSKKLFQIFCQKKIKDKNNELKLKFKKRWTNRACNNYC
jgi:hypothetical protein